VRQTAAPTPNKIRLIFSLMILPRFRFIAGVSRRWKRLYTQFQREEYRKRVPDEEEFNKLISTSITSAASIADTGEWVARKIDYRLHHRTKPFCRISKR
jgi:hypothetical protein